MPTKQRALSWKPRLQGPIYCAPACGGNCTKKAYDQAVKDASVLAKLMGKGWAPFVHENLGWHYSVYWVADPENIGNQPKLGLRISPFYFGGKRRFYIAFMGGMNTDTASTPKKALRKVVEIEQAVVDLSLRRIAVAKKVLRS